MDKFRMLKSSENTRVYEMFQPFESFLCMSHLDFMLERDNDIKKIT